MDFFESAAYCEENFGSEVFEDEETNVIFGFICPNCGELIYSEDWSKADTEGWTRCPICEELFCEEGEED